MIALTLFLRRWWPYLTALILLIVFGGCGARWLSGHDARVRRDGVLSVLVPEAKIESVTVVVRDTIVVHDTVRLNRFLVRYDTARVTLNVHDTVQVRAFVAAADSTVRACRETIVDLLSSCAAKDTMINTQRRIIAAYQSAPGTPERPPSRHWHLGATAGYGMMAVRDSAGGRRLVTGPSLTLGGTWTPF